MTLGRSLISTTFIFCVFCSVNAAKVSVYYEVLCPDSVRFITQQLYPHHAQLEKYIKLDLVPYGKALHYGADGKWTFRCQHGPQECQGNKYQACALAHNKGQQNDMNFVNCVMKKRNPASLAIIESCSKQHDFDFQKIKTCAQSTEGDNLLAIKGNQTLSLDPNLSFVPTVIFDDVFDQNTQDQSVKDFTAVVCSKIVNGTKPSICDNRKLPKIRSFDFDLY